MSPVHRNEPVPRRMEDTDHANTGAYSVSEPDHALSPYTGMARKHWIECGKYILERAFRHVKRFEDLLLFPVIEGRTYPRPGDPPWRYRSLEFEGLRRTMTLAAPLMHVDPDVTINGYALKDYYGHHLLQALTPGHPSSIPLPEELPDATYQFTCELGGLCMLLLCFSDTVWPFYARKEQDAIAVTLSKWGHHRTTQNNWRLFNIEMLSFLKLHGYEIDEAQLADHLDWIASYHAGQGWYLEQNYNYYTISMYSLYETVWCRAYGDRYAPEPAAIFESTVRRLLESYPYLFGRDGYINMWARSILYRLWVAGGFPVAFMLKSTPPLDPGWARRLCSGAVLQFVGREDFWEHDIPSLGFYGHREYLLQSYSCSASPFTMFMPFLNLALPEGSPFWTATENEGPWESLGSRSKNIVLDKPGIMLTIHGKTGASEIRPAKVNEENHNYNRLCYNTHFPWEDHDPEGGTAMEYSFKSLDPRDLAEGDTLFYLGLTKEAADEGGDRTGFSTPKAVYYNRCEGDVLYRQIIMKTPPNSGCGYTIDLAEIILPGGSLRVDRCRLAFEHVLTLGHFGLPHVGGVPARVQCITTDDAKGLTASIDGRRIALMAFHGWDGVASRTHPGMNAEADESTIIYAHRTRQHKNPRMELMVSLLLHRTDNAEWADDELYPIKNMRIRRFMPSGSVLGAQIELKDGSSYLVDFGEIDGTRRC